MQAEERTLFGFWVYLMTDCILFSMLFATYFVLHRPHPHLFNLPLALAETIALLASSFASGLAMLPSASKKSLLSWFAVTFLLGASFLFMEITEFLHLATTGHSPQSEASLSAFFTLVGTHGAHISIGLLWMIVLLVPVIKRGLTPVSMKRLRCFRLFWHFLDVVWIFIFTIVYLMGSYA